MVASEHTIDNIIQFPLQRADVNITRGFYTAKQAARLSRVPRSTVSTWANKGVVVPDVTWTDETGKDNPGYTFSGLVYLRLIGMLRKESFPLRKAVNAIFHLTDVFGPPGSSWGNARIFSDGRDLWVDHRNEWGVTAATRRGQKAAHELFGPQFALLRERADALLVPRSFGRHVEIDPSVKNGLPVIRRTSIQTETIHSLHANGLSHRRIKDYYPHLSHPQIVQADRFEYYLDSGKAAA